MYLPSRLALAAIASFLVGLADVQAQKLRDFAAANLDVGGASLQRAVNSQIHVFDGNLSIGSNGVITGRLLERQYADKKWNAQVVPRSILAGSKISLAGVISRTNTYPSVENSTFFPPGSRRGERSVSTNVHTVVTHSANFLINMAGGHLAKGHAFVEFETRDSRSVGGRSVNSWRLVFLEGAVFRQNGAFVGPFHAVTRLPQ
jgi:hypothetical protein